MMFGITEDKGLITGLKKNTDFLGANMNPNIIKNTIFWIVSVSFLLAVGCSKLTTENYDQLKVGMNYDEVVTILGKADECSGAIGIKNCTWGNDKKYVTVSFAGNKVIVFSGHGL